MLFNSLSFLIFLPIVFILYWFVVNKNLKQQNLLILIASYYFYSSWDTRFLFLLIFSTLLDFFTGIKMKEASSIKNKKFWFWLSIGINLGFLGTFKYFNFFASSFAEALNKLGLHVDPVTLNIILPVGISFYTFHGLSYVIDIYKDKIQPERNFVDYAVFVSFFPLLVAGPIERATHLLPQIKKERIFKYDKAVDGMRQILWGFFKKVVIADNCAEYANEIFNNYTEHNSSTLVIGAFFFTIQIYCDFSGYSDIALGTARLFGIELLRNFAYPYFSRDIAEFWRRWHISLSSWFRDYIYIPLGGSKVSVQKKIRNTFIIFLISGFWHGANWTFIIWGALNAFYFLPLLLSDKNRTNIETVAQGKLFPSLKELLGMFFTFSLTIFAWIFFRAQSVSDAFHYISLIFTKQVFSAPTIIGTTLLILISIFFIMEWLGRERQHPLALADKVPNKILRWGTYFTILMMIIIFGSFNNTEFIYFAF
ncbi:MAG: MBOAT family protein [Bacteroidetes bacterium]|nr:MBOAT family protein [Bacteroidota bacterium]